MKIIWALLLCIVSHPAIAQGNGEHVQVWLNSRVVVKKYTTGGTAQTVTLTRPMLAKANTLKIMQTGFNEAGWKRQLALLDSNGNEVINFEKNGASGTWNWKINNLEALLKKHGRLLLHTMALPTDPRQAALVRVARYHVCTLVYKPQELHRP